jgi:hypothetical protein
MRDDGRSAFWSGGRQLWRHRRVLVGVYALNVLLAALATVPVHLRLSRILNHSTSVERLYSGVDVGLFAELASPAGGDLAAEPSVAMTLLPVSATSAVMFLAVMVFLGGGILTSYGSETPLSAARFFAACGTFAPRLLRIFGWLVLALLPVLGALRGLGAWLDQRAEASPGETLGLWFTAGRVVVVLLALMAVRLWFDMAQVHAVSHPDRHGMRRCVGFAFLLTRTNLGSLYWLYLRVSLLTGAGVAGAVWVWARFVAPQSVAWAFLVGQAALMIWLAGRLWQRASEVAWYQRHELSGPVAVSAASRAA